MFYLVKKINKTVCAAWKQWAKKHGSNPLLATLTSVPPWPQPLFLISLAKVSTDRATRCLKIAENMKRATMSTCDFLPPLTPIRCHICHHMTRCECERMDYSVSSPQAWVLVRIQEKKGVILSGGLKNPDDVEQNSVWDCPESSYDWSGKLLTIIKKKLLLLSGTATDHSSHWTLRLGFAPIISTILTLGAAYSSLLYSLTVYDGKVFSALRLCLLLLFHVVPAGTLVQLCREFIFLSKCCDLILFFKQYL